MSGKANAPANAPLLPPGRRPAQRRARPPLEPLVNDPGPGWAGSPAPPRRLEEEIVVDLADVWFGEYLAVAVLLGALARSPV